MTKEILRRYVFVESDKVSVLLSMKQTNHVIYLGYRSAQFYVVKWSHLLYQKLLLDQDIALMSVNFHQTHLKYHYRSQWRLTQ